MQQRRCGLFMVLSFLLQMGKADVFSGDHDRYMTRTGEGRRWSDSPVLVYRHVDQDGQEKTLGLETPGWQRGGDRDSLHALVNTLNAQHQARLDSFSRDMTRVDSLLTQSSQTHARLAKLMPAALLESRFRQAPRGHGAVSLLAQPEQEVRVENAPVSARYIVTVNLQVDVRRLNVSLLKRFREGVAAALDISPRHVHINRINERKNGIELYVSSDRPGATEPLPAEEVIQSLNINILHRSLGHFGITEVSSEKNVLQDQHERDNVWTKEGFFAAVIFLTIFIIITTCLMVLYRLKEKVEYSDRQIKEQPVFPSRDLHLTPVTVAPPVPLHAVGAQTQPQVPFSSSMVQAEPAPPSIPTFIPPPRACRPPPTTPVPIPVSSCGPPPTTPVPVPVSSCGPPPTTPVPIPVSSCGPPPTTPVPIPVSSCGPPQLSPAHQKPCLSASPSPFRMKPAACLQERRGSNVSLVLDMSSLASVEPLNCGVVTPRERATQEYLQSSGRTLSRQQLRDVVLNTQTLHAEFAEIPMNFVDPKVMDISSHGTKNRYKTILPNPHSRVILRTKSSFDPLSSYINANYIRGYLGDEKAYIATQGPMINTVNDFWQMAWQEDCPVIIMITKLREKNEKCVLYWPERRGIYGKVEVLINNVTECDNYTCRTLTLKQGAQSRVVKHYWYTSWPDHKTPDSAQPLLQLMRDVEEDRTGSPSQGPVIVHCSAGIGRTGCFIATTIGCRQLEMEGVVDVLGIVCQLRADRGGLIQTGEQYEFVHHALSLFETGLSADTGQ
ncbi:receptor-type tyrosine-protein phosphatase R-like isoform X1 [Salvelinus fontinalis]|uniref:receptor-type tyrosine-protein phosphatase R-like isoform X1 n=1 Tax=Salvelinus fontinalis TaxID=8038 RepID=UPI002486344C|nr:receptor-type tyrosine-protein phosphatase R-like isoform X1 [Salvelinus fontinalis]